MGASTQDRREKVAGCGGSVPAVVRVIQPPSCPGEDTLGVQGVGVPGLLRHPQRGQHFTLAGSIPALQARRESPSPEVMARSLSPSTAQRHAIAIAASAWPAAAA